MFLPDEDFSKVIENTPLVSIDLVVYDSNGRVLLGKRKNRPARGHWFVPGGRIQKNESLSAAFERLTSEELGLKQDYASALLLGAYDHFYTDSVFGDTPNTHYVALAHKVSLSQHLQLPNYQHSEYRWFSVNELLEDGMVHANTRAYFQP